MEAPSLSGKRDLMVEIERAWSALQALLNRLSKAQLTTLADAHGWSVKDHLLHLAAWERSVVFFLQGKPRHAGLGIDESLYLSGSEDDLNAAIFRQNQELSLAEALATLSQVHRQLLQVLEPLTDRDLQRPYRYYLPAESGTGDGPSALEVVYSNSAQHFAEHEAWIEALVAEVNL
jgi:hypothetical protein